MRVNLAPNYTFLNGDLSGWSAENSASIAYTSDYAFYGEGALLVTKGAINASGVVMNQPIPVQAGMPYAFSMYARLPLSIPASDPAELALTVTWANSTGAVVSTNTSGNLVLDSDDKWYRISGVWNAPAGATLISSIRIYQPVGGRLEQQFVLDALLVEQASYVGGFFFTYSESEKYRIAQKALSRVPQVINGLRLGADVSLNSLTFNTIDEFGTIWVVENITGWDGQTAPEMPDIGRGTDDGSYDVEGRLTSRAITLSGFFIPANPDQALTDTKDRLVEAINLVRKGGWLRAHSEPTRAAWVRLSSAPSITTVNDRGRTQFSISLRAPDPIKYHWNDSDPDGYTGTTVRSYDVPDGVQTNIWANPSFETTSGAVVEVRRNLCVNPQPATGFVTGWASSSGATMSAEGFTTIPTTATTAFINSANASATISVGRTYLFRAKVTGTTLSGAQVATQLIVRPHKTNGDVYYTPIGGNVSVPADGVTREVSFMWTATAAVTTTDGFNVSVVANAATDANTFRLSMTDVLIEDAGTNVPSSIRPFFFGGVVSPDTDLTSAWVGTAYNSASVLRGVNATTSVTSTAAAAVRSSLWANRGTYSLRIVPNGTNAYNYATIAPDALQVAKTYTVMGKIRISNAATGSGTNARRIIFTQTGFPDQVSDAAPNVPGVYDLRLVISTNPAMGAYSLRLGGSGDPFTEVWWDDVLVVEGDYTGPYFDGNSTGTPNYTYRWLGEPNASNSERVRYDVDIVKNIGNATVSGLFTITGPAGPGTRIYNSLTDETITLAQPLRGKSTVGTVIKMAALNGVATLTTDRYSGLRPGDRVTLVGLPVPFTTPGQVYTVKAASDAFPFSFSFDVSTDDIDEVTVSGQVTLEDNDVLIIDTYEKSVVYNGEVTGHRYRLVTLTDWVKFGPGNNPIEYFDDALQINVLSKQLSGITATLETHDIHYLRPGDRVLVALPETANLSKKSLTSNVVTLTTDKPHGFAAGDTIDVVSVESSVVSFKARTGSAVTLTTVAENGISVNDFVTVALPVSATPSSKQLTSNVATITTQNPHGFSIGDSVTVALPATAQVSAKQLFSNVATLSTVGAHGYAVGDSITVSMPTGAAIVKKEKIGSMAYLTSATAHGYSVGDTVIVNLPSNATISALSADGTSNLITVTVTSAHNFSIGDKVSISTTSTPVRSPTSRSATTATCTLTLGTSHGWLAGDRITVTGIDGRFNGTFTLSSVAATTVSYANPGATVSATATTGAEATNLTLLNTYNGDKVIETMPTSTTFTFRDWDQNTNVASRSLSGTVSNNTNIAFSGTKTLQSASGTVFTYNL